MTVSALLAGFVLTALSGLLLLSPGPWTVEQVVAVIALASSLTLFTACVYIYDQMGMPTGFWTDARRPRLWAPLYRRAEHRREMRWHSIAAVEGVEAADEDLRPWLQDGRTALSLHDQDVSLAVHSRDMAGPRWVSGAAKGTGDLRILAGAAIGLLIAGGFAITRRPDLGAD